VQARHSWWFGKPHHRTEASINIEVLDVFVDTAGDSFTSRPKFIRREISLPQKTFSPGGVFKYAGTEFSTMIEIFANLNGSDGE